MQMKTKVEGRGNTLNQTRSHVPEQLLSVDRKLQLCAEKQISEGAHL